MASLSERQSMAAEVGYDSGISGPGKKVAYMNIPSGVFA
jgi:hypothetical protein